MKRHNKEVLSIVLMSALSLGVVGCASDDAADDASSQQYGTQSGTQSDMPLGGAEGPGAGTGTPRDEAPQATGEGTSGVGGGVPLGDSAPK